MAQHIQLVLLASIVASCISYSIDSSKTMSVPEPPGEPSESEFSKYPTKFMQKLLAALSPEELKELQKPIILGKLSDRTGIEGERPCHKQQLNRTFDDMIVKAKDGEHYVVPTQLVKYFACDRRSVNGIAYDNKCGPVDNHDGLNTAYCCVQNKKTILLDVVPEPTSKIDVCFDTLLCYKGTQVEYKVYKTIKMEVSVNNDCVCNEYPQESPVSDGDYTCPRPDSSALKIYSKRKF